MPTLVEINMTNKHTRLRRIKEKLLSEYCLRRLTNLPMKKREDHHMLTNQGYIIELFILYEEFEGKNSRGTQSLFLFL